MSKRLEVRCFCKREPLLAVCGRDAKSGDLFVHIKSVKNQRISTEVVVTSGVVRVRCKECLRWHKIRILPINIEHKAEELPASLNIN